MKKRGFLLAVCTVGVMLSGCGHGKPPLKPFMKRIMFILGVSIIMALLTVTAALAGWWLGASLPLDISDTTQQIAALLTASACTWILYIVSRKVLTKISLKPY